MIAPLISVLVPCYNAQNYIIETIKSIQNQTFNEIEILVVDDGSTDNSAEIIKNLQTEDHRIRYIFQENQGLPGARNTGLDHAKGKYISFVDNDDLLHPQFLEILLRNIENSNADISICEFENFEDGTAMVFPEIDNSTEVFLLQDFSLFINTNVRFVVMWNKLYRKEIFEGLRFRLGKWHEDESMVHYIYARANRVVKSSAILYGYRNVVTSMARSNYRESRFWDILESLKDRKNFYKKNNWKHTDSIDLAKWSYIYWFAVRRHRAPFAMRYLLRHPAGFFKYAKLSPGEKFKEYFRISGKIILKRF